MSVCLKSDSDCVAVKLCSTDIFLLYFFQIFKYLSECVCGLGFRDLEFGIGGIALLHWPRIESDEREEFCEGRVEV